VISQMRRPYRSTVRREDTNGSMDDDLGPTDANGRLLPMHATGSERLLDVAQAARRLRCSTDTVRRRIRSGELEAFRVGEHGGIRIAEETLDALLVPYLPNERRVR
jgi:excisionase family DNA binding protein